MCGNKRKQRQAQKAALAALTSRAVQDADRPLSSKTTRTSDQAIATAVPSEAPPPYHGHEKPIANETTDDASEFSHESIARGWLGPDDGGDRRPSFNTFHSFDTRPTSANQRTKPLVQTPEQGKLIRRPSCCSD